MVNTAGESGELVARRGRRRLLSRRGLLRLGIGGTAAVALGGGYAHFVEPFWPEYTRVRMDIPRLSPAFEGFRILQLSDLHATDDSIADFLRGEVARCVALRPDLIVITGDFVTSGNASSIRHVRRALEGVQADSGVVASLGNHDYTNLNWNLPRRQRVFGGTRDLLVPALRELGVRTLQNERLVLERDGARLQIVGLGDLFAGEFDAAKAFTEVEPETPCIALSHNPDTIASLKNRPCDWVLCGHTHGGQVRLPIYGPLYVPVRRRQYSAGLFEVEGTRLYVNRGLGHLAQIRFNCRPEITEFALARRA